ncbi:MAG: 6,7-dimethyl-8-ribityllumazine synthase [Nitrospinota bacterium]|nr:6,7-dimethyl-8-ribityllumazine synthase [Nitrospinota bacterium]
MGESKERILDGMGLRIAIVYSEYNQSIVHSLFRGAMDGLSTCKVSNEDIFYRSVPGAFEIPLAVKNECANPSLEKHYDAIIALGCVIRGATSHYDLICNEVTRSLMSISLEFNVPILHGILTTENIAQAKERSGEKMNNKGYECALSAVEMGLMTWQ